MLNPAQKVRDNSKVTFNNALQHMDVPVLVNYQILIYISYDQTVDVVKRTCKNQRPIKMDGERKFASPVPSARLDDDNELLNVGI